MKTTVVNVRITPCEVYVGRPTKWGNPFRLYPFGGRSREQAVEQYREWIAKQPMLLAALPELRGKVLGCWCAPKPCHGDVLAVLADKEE